MGDAEAAAQELGLEVAAADLAPQQRVKVAAKTLCHQPQRLTDAAQRELAGHCGHLALRIEFHALGDEEGLGVIGHRQQVWLLDQRVEQRQAGAHCGCGDDHLHAAAAGAAVEHDFSAERAEAAAYRRGVEVQQFEVDETVRRVQDIGHGLRRGRRCGGQQGQGEQDQAHGLHGRRIFDPQHLSG